MTELVLIAAMDRQRAIGRDNALPWHLPDDLKHFKALTIGQPVLMGRKTAQSLGRALPGRKNLVLTRSNAVPFAGMQAVESLDAALAEAGGMPVLWVIGGGEVYSICLPRAARMHLTEVDTQVENADAFFPPINEAQWELVTRVDHSADARHAHAFSMTELRRRARSADRHQRVGEN